MISFLLSHYKILFLQNKNGHHSGSGSNDRFIPIIYYGPFLALDDAFLHQQIILSSQTAGVAAQRAVTFDHSVAGGEDGHGILLAGLAHRLDGFGAADGFRDLGVGAVFPEGDPAQFCPDLLLEIGSFLPHGNGEGSANAGEVFIQFAHHFGQELRFLGFGFFAVLHFTHGGEIFQVFTTEFMLELYNEMATTLEPEMALHFARWAEENDRRINFDSPLTPEGALSYWYKRLDFTRNVMKKRPTYLYEMIQEQFQLTDGQMVIYFGEKPEMPADAIL